VSRVRYAGQGRNCWRVLRVVSAYRNAVILRFTEFESGFCAEALNEAIHKFGPPEIMNTDQGSRFTSFVWTDRLQRSGLRISMDGKGRFLDNIFVERLWRSLKYECVYLYAWETGSKAKAGVKKWVAFYNHKRPHSALGGQPPAVIYWQRNETTQPGQQVQRVA